MAWTNTNPVSIGNATKKSHYDDVWDNADYNRDSAGDFSAVIVGTGITTTAIYHKDSTTTGLSWPVANELAIYTAGTEAVRVDSSQRLLVGHTAAVPLAGTVGQIELHGATSATSGLSLTQWANDTTGASLFFGKSRGGTVGTNAIIADNDRIGGLVFAADDGTNLASISAEIVVEIDGTPGVGDVPARVVIKTTADGQATTTEAIRWNSAQQTVLPAGSVATPSLCFSETGSGLYRVGANHIGIGIGGTLGFDIDASRNSTFAGDLTISGQTIVKAGTVANPSIVFSGSTSSGLYAVGNNHIGIGIGGTLGFDIDSSRNSTFAGDLTISDGLLTVTQTTAGTKAISINMPTGVENTASGLKISGYSPSIELMDKDGVQNWYMGIDDNTSDQFQIGRGYGPGQGTTPSLVIDVSNNITLTGWIATGGETAPDVTDGGICLNQGALDANILTFKSSDVAHSITNGSGAETDTYGKFRKLSGSAGGLAIEAFSDSDALGLLLVGVNGSNTPTTGAIRITPKKYDGAIGYTHMGANELMLDILGAGSGGIRFYGGTTTGVVMAFEVTTANPASVTDYAFIFSKDVASSAEMFVMDEGGTATQISPHNFSLMEKSEEMAWSFYSEKDGKIINVDMLKTIRLVEKLSKEKLVYIK